MVFPRLESLDFYKSKFTCLHQAVSNYLPYTYQSSGLINLPHTLHHMSTVRKTSVFNYPFSISTAVYLWLFHNYNLFSKSFKLSFSFLQSCRIHIVRHTFKRKLQCTKHVIYLWKKDYVLKQLKISKH